MEMIELDGGQGGGQLLRTALSLSLCTGIGFTMQNIRAKRSRSGLMRQHLTAVQAAAEIGRARVHGAELGATTIRFEPGTVQPGDYRFSIGSAGSTTLVLQTLLPALWQCSVQSTLRLEGGTHNPLAPCADFVSDTYLPAVSKMGVSASLSLDSYGFFPAGGGAIAATVSPCDELQSISLVEQGDVRVIQATALLSSLSADIGRRELAVLADRLGLADESLLLRPVRPAVGPGNALLVQVRRGTHVETFTGFGERGVSAETVANRLADEVLAYAESGACVAEHLADQLLLPMAVAGAGAFTTTLPSDHFRSNAAVIEKFLPIEFVQEQLNDKQWRVTVSA